MDEFSKPKIVWGNLNTHASYTLAPEHTFINAPACMIVPASKYLLCILNSRIADYYMRNLGVVRNGGFFEYKPMFIEQIPIPMPTRESEERINEEFFKNQSKEEFDANIEAFIESLYNLSNEEVAFIRSVQ